MNIFILDKNLKKSAEMLSDQHLIKQVLELAQIICTVKNLQGLKTPYRPTHKNHPATKWAAKNEFFCWRYFYLLVDEHHHRSGKYHKSFVTLKEAFGIQVMFFDYEAPTDFPIRNDLQLVKEKYKEWVSRPKPMIPRWTNREIPECFKEVLGD